MSSINLNTDFKKLTVVKLREIAKEMHIFKWYSLNKQPLIEAIILEMKNEYINEFHLKNKCNALLIDGYVTKKCKNYTNSNDKFCCHHKEQYKFEKPSECSICFDTLDDKEIPLSCGHWFHKSCIQQIKKDTCPLCRKKLSIEELYFLNSTYFINTYSEIRQSQRNIIENQRQQREEILRRVDLDQEPLPTNRIQTFTSNILRWFGF